MSSKHKIRCCLAIVVAFLGLSQSQLLAFAAPEGINRISPSEVDDLKLNASEFFLDGQQTGTANNSQELYAPPVFNQQGATRTIEWQMRVCKEDLPSPVEVEYKLRAKNLTENRFTQSGSSSKFIPVTIADSELETLEDGSELETVILKGKVTLNFDVSKFRDAGVYQGKLLVDVKNTSDACKNN